MTTSTYEIEINGIRVEVVRKAIKNLHVGVYPPAGRVRVAAPFALSDDAIRLAVVNRLGWIRRQQAKFEAQVRESRREMLTGETHFFLGQRYRLEVLETSQRPKVEVKGKSIIGLHVRPEMNTAQREDLLHRWYRVQLKIMVPPLVEKWQHILGVEVSGWGIKKMKTKWGSCNVDVRHIWINLELAKKPSQCLEYVVVHEMVHLLERSHGPRFLQLMDQVLPRWRLVRAELKELPLGNEKWTT